MGGFYFGQQIVMNSACYTGPFIPYAATQILTYPLVRYQMQQQATQGLTSVTFKEIMQRSKFQGLFLDLVNCSIPILVRRAILFFVRKGFFGYELPEFIEDIPVIWISQLIGQPLRSIHHIQATFNERKSISYSWGCLNHSPKLLYQGLFINLVYEGLFRFTLYYFTRNIPKYHYILYVLSSTLLYPLQNIRAQQMESAVFGENQSIIQAYNEIYEKNGLKGFWAGYLTNITHQSVLMTFVALYDFLMYK